MSPIIVATDGGALDLYRDPSISRVPAVTGLDPAIDPAIMPRMTSADILLGGPYATVDDVLRGLGLPDDLHEKIHQGLSEAVRTGNPLRAAVVGPIRVLREYTNDPVLARIVALRFAAMLGNGLAKSLSTETPPPGFSPIPNSKKGGYHKKEGAGYIYWYPGVGITRESRESGAGGAGTGSKDEKPEDNQEVSVSRPAGYMEVGEVLADPDSFNSLSKMERALHTADFNGDIVPLLEEYAYSKGEYADSSVTAIMSSVGKHLSELVESGKISNHVAMRVRGICRRLLHYGEKAGVSMNDLATLVQQDVQKVVLQEARSAERTLSDHGSRHIYVNIQNAIDVMNALENGGIDLKPRDYLVATQVMIDHDMGYTIPAIHEGRFKVKDNYHPAASRVLFEQQTGLRKLFGSELADKMGEFIETHSQSKLDWQNDPIGSAIRMADNTHLFVDKLPEVLYDDRKGAELLAKIHLLKQMYGITDENWKEAFSRREVMEGIEKLKGAVRNYIESRSDLSVQERARLLKAVKDIGPATDVFIASRLAGRNPEYHYKGGTMEVNIEQSGIRKAVAEIFGRDAADAQFVKMLDDFGYNEGNLNREPPPDVRVELPRKGKPPAAVFTWHKPDSARAEGKEAQYASVFRSVEREWRKIQKIKSDAERRVAIDKFFGELSKSLLSLWTY